MARLPNQASRGSIQTGNCSPRKSTSVNSDALNKLAAFEPRFGHRANVYGHFGQVQPIYPKVVEIFCIPNELRFVQQSESIAHFLLFSAQ